MPILAHDNLARALARFADPPHEILRPPQRRRQRHQLHHVCHNEFMSTPQPHNPNPEP